MIDSQDLKMLVDHNKQLLRIESRTLETFDATIVYVSALWLISSLLFSRLIYNDAFNAIVAVSWFVFFFAIVTSLTARILTAQAASFQKQINERTYTGQTQSFEHNHFDTYARICRYASYVLFFAGGILLLVSGVL